MKIHSVSVLLAAPIIVLSVLFGYLVLLKEESGYLPFLIIAVILLVAIYTLQPHIDFLWYKKHPARLDPKETVFLEKFSTFYNELDENQKEKFEKRVYVFKRAKSFKLMVMETVEMPEDFKIAIASSAVQLTFNHDDYLFKNYDHFFAYQHPFPSPEIQMLHSVEIKLEDRMTIFDIEMLVNSFNPQNRLFNIGLYAFAVIYFHINPGLSFDSIKNEIFWEKLKIISGFDKNYITLATGIEPDLQFAVLSTLFFTHNSGFKAILPIQYEQLSRIFNFEI